jgi:hypothetical protein
MTGVRLIFKPLLFSPANTGRPTSSAGAHAVLFAAFATKISVMMGEGRDRLGLSKPIPAAV